MQLLLDRPVQADATEPPEKVRVQRCAMCKLAVPPPSAPKPPYWREDGGESERAWYAAGKPNHGGFCWFWRTGHPDYYEE